MTLFFILFDSLQTEKKAVLGWIVALFVLLIFLILLALWWCWPRISKWVSFFNIDSFGFFMSPFERSPLRISFSKIENVQYHTTAFLFPVYTHLPASIYKETARRSTRSTSGSSTSSSPTGDSSSSSGTLCSPQGTDGK